MTQERAAEREAALVDARDAASLREQFVAILAHDLRNPLTSIDAGIEVLMHRGPDEKTLREGELASVGMARASRRTN
jgi:signal transduction histidine kinase